MLIRLILFFLSVNCMANVDEPKKLADYNLEEEIKEYDVDWDYSDVWVNKCKIDQIVDTGQKTKEGRMILRLIRHECRWRKMGY